ncbi:hypothetical protein CIPAW_05G087900 [Carya illinoinensis]|uniref:Uncharacterized protein n=1 Tax=Carya illinoinensis TaxID=32201 RepID=A0A8T1QGQ6_CARIL|nr:hypothetical protein CIPAW_05G087900 [Carya illinoinensis]
MVQAFPSSHGQLTDEANAALPSNFLSRITWAQKHYYRRRSLVCNIHNKQRLPKQSIICLSDPSVISLFRRHLKSEEQQMTHNTSVTMLLLCQYAWRFPPILDTSLISYCYNLILVPLAFVYFALREEKKVER